MSARRFENLTPDQRAMRSKLGTIGAHESWARTSDRPARTANARRTFLERFEREVDPDGTLPADERAKRVENAKAAYFRRLALKSAQKRRSAA